MEIETQFDRDLATIKRAYRRVLGANIFHQEQHSKPIILTIAILLLCWSNLHHDSRILRTTNLERKGDDAMFRAPSISHATDIVQLAKNHKESSNISAAVCFKTLFGDIDLGTVIQWAAYNRLLGFDHIFMWYRPEMESVDRFDELMALPFVTLTLNTEGKRSNYFNQWEMEIKCLKDPMFANNYTWAMLADIDEYLWFSKQIGIKPFLHQHDAMTYISLGKQMYTLDHRVDANFVNHKIATDSRDHFAVANYPFHMKHFCYHKTRIGDPICPTWRGRSKVIVRPKIHQRIDTHGTIHHPDPAKGTIHMSPESAHFKEWPEIFAAHNVTQRPAKEFLVQTYEEVHIHNLKRAFQPADTRGNYLVQMDSGLMKWFDYVIRRGKSDHLTLIQ